MKDGPLKDLLLITLICLLIVMVLNRFVGNLEIERLNGEEKQIVTRCLNAAKKTQDVVKASESCVFMQDNFEVLKHGAVLMMNDKDITKEQAEQITEFFAKRAIGLK
jgi:hypothetical protein